MSYQKESDREPERDFERVGRFVVKIQLKLRPMKDMVERSIETEEQMTTFGKNISEDFSRGYLFAMNRVLIHLKGLEGQEDD